MKLKHTLKFAVARTARPPGAAWLCAGAAKLQRKNKIRTEAFTLIELLLGIVIFAIVVMAMNTVFYSGLRLERSTTRALDERAGLNQAFAVLRRDLQGAVPPNTNGVFLCDFRSGASLGGNTMGGSKGGSIEFCTTTGVIRDELPWGDVQRVRYELVSPANRETRGQDLVRVVTRNLLPTLSEETATQWLMGNVERMEFLAYDGSSWRNSWDTTLGDTGLPVAVRVQVMLANTNLASNGSLMGEPLELLVPLVVQVRTNTATSVIGGEE